jgi:hypothetical protein
MNATAWFRTTNERNFRQIVKVQQVEVCSAMKNIEKFPVFKDFVDFLDMVFPGLVQKCPYKGVSKRFFRKCHNHEK